MDGNYILENREAFLKIIKEHPKVQLIICGHVHGDYTIKTESFTLEAGPATCFQMQKGSTTLNISEKLGYKVYCFDEAGYTAQSNFI